MESKWQNEITCKYNYIWCWGCFFVVVALFTDGLFTSPSLNGCPFKWQCPVYRPVTCLSRFLLSPHSSLVLFAEDSWRKPVICPCPGIDFHCSWWSLFTFLRCHACLDPVNGHRIQLIWAGQQSDSLHFHSVQHTHLLNRVQSVLLWIDGSPNLFITLLW